MATHSDVLADLAAFRAQLQGLGSEHVNLLRVSPWRPLLDLTIDWLIVLACVHAVLALGAGAAPLAILLIANRQRALGNILHDAGHRNLCRRKRWNDLMAQAFVAPLLFSSLSVYRESHYRHHLALGTRSGDPDLLPVPDRWPSHWFAAYWQHLRCASIWRGSFAGHLVSPDASPLDKLYILGWWMLVCAVLTAGWGAMFSGAFLALWLAARATAFHAITTLREMCDHYGLQPGGILSFTRDLVCHGFWRALIHPRNNGYHLTHHLLPAVPYYRLPQAQRMFDRLPLYREHATVCRNYFRGEQAVTRAWQASTAT